MMVILVASFTTAPPAKRFTPVGIWEYSILDVPPEYAKGQMIIEKGKDGYTVTMGSGENYRTNAEDVVYKKKALSFTLHVESEAVSISGTFEKDSFAGTVSLSEGEFDLSASRKAKK